VNRVLIIAVMKARGLVERDATGELKLTPKGREELDVQAMLAELGRERKPPRGKPRVR
jgi:Mn-dependent DtxR family transcriptional regulator